MLTEPMICVPILEKSIDSALKSSNKAIKLGADILELRIDTLDNPDSDKILNLIDKLNHRFIATNRMHDEGGFFKGSELERTEILVEVAESVDFVDIELQTHVKYRSKVIKSSPSCIISYHDFKKTPNMSELLNVVEKEKDLGDIAKFAVMPRNIQDTLTVLEVLSRVSNTIGISMGDLGKYTRVVAPLFGSPLTFASVDVESAPGQLNINTTRNILKQL
ncbi:MAG: type I 3-dehydroquinate dehydratase [Methanobacterium sp.]